MRKLRKATIVRNNLTHLTLKSQENNHPGVVIKHFLKKKGMTQTALAKKVGVSKPTVTNWIKGEHSFQTDHLEKILQAFEIDFIEFATVANRLPSWGKYNPDSRKK